MKLLLDMGNTRLKWALQPTSSAGWLAHGSMDWQGGMLTGLAAAWASLPRPTAVVAASVVDSEREAQLAAVSRGLWRREPHWLRTPASACGVRNAYAEPERLGVDRFLAMVAAHADGHGACVLASAGTALTLDAMTADGRHLGGLIAPGVQLMQQSLLQATARVRPERPGRLLELADNTADAVSSGCWQAVIALVERFAGRMEKQLAAVPTLILAGGDAQQLAALLPLPAQLSRDSVLRGLALWAQTHMPAPSTD
ncbi:MAG TPA: type III pantothenate kinase [Rhodanobacter sp.]|nr:type III pantothenate kinase [Rhodanobacter sp.]